MKQSNSRFVVTLAESVCGEGGKVVYSSPQLQEAIEFVKRHAGNRDFPGMRIEGRVVLDEIETTTWMDYFA